jgi:hypothetical protein
MKFTKITPSVLLAVALSLAGSAVASAQVPGPLQKVALLPMSGTNVHPGYLDAGRDIMKDHLLATGRFQVITVPGESGNQEVPVEQALALGRQAGAELALVTHLTRLGGTGRVRLIAYRIGDGAVSHADSIAFSGGPDDLDPALRRLAMGLATGKRAEQTAEIDSVTQKDADPFLKQEATRSFGLRLGALVPLSRPADLDPKAYPGIGIFWMYDARSFIGEVAVDLNLGNDADSEANESRGGGSFSIGIGGYYPFSRGNLTPYVGGAVAYAFSNQFGGGGGNGIRLTPTFGVLFGRLSTVQFRGEIGYFINTFGERAYASVYSPNQSQATTPDSSSSRVAHGPTMGIGIGF